MGKMTDVIVLGDRETTELSQMISERAAENDSRIVEVFTFEKGEVVGQDDLAQVDAVVGAIGRAITTRTCVWVPFPMQDLCREQHVRRLTMVLQRHGLNLLLGSDLSPCTEGGYTEIDFALRQEVRAVDDLDGAAIAAAGIGTLVAEIEQALTDQPAESAGLPGNGRGAGVFDVGERFYSTGEVARLFGKSDDWVSRGLRENVFTYPDGSPIEPVRIGKGGRRRFTVPVLCAIAKSCYRRGTLTEQQLKSLLKELAHTAKGEH